MFGNGVAEGFFFEPVEATLFCRPLDDPNGLEKVGSTGELKIKFKNPLKLKDLHFRWLSHFHYVLDRDQDRRDRGLVLHPT